MKIALFGGSFNPVHNGHLEIANKIIREKIADEVWIIPCGNHAFGKEFCSGEDRVKMIKLAIGGNDKIKIIGVELNEKKSYTAETVRWFKNEFKHEFFIVIGSDNLVNINRWKDFNYLREQNFIIARRKGFDIIDKGLKKTLVLNIDEGISSEKIRQLLKRKENVEGFVPKEVESYIKFKELYK